MIWPRPPRLLAGAARAFAKLAAAEHHRRHRLGRLDRIVRTPDGKAVTSSPSLPGRAPVPPQWKMTVLNGGVSASEPSPNSSCTCGAAVDLRVPEGGGAFGRDAARHHLMQAAEHDVGQHVRRPCAAPRRRAGG